MKSDSQLPVTHSKIALPYIFAKKAHRIMWAIGALVLFMTVPFLNSQSQENAESLQEEAAPVQPTDKVAPTLPDVETNTAQSQDNTSSIRINDQLIPLPSNGSIHKTIQSDNGHTKLDASIDTSSSSDQSHSSTNIHLNVTSRQETTIDNSE